MGREVALCSEPRPKRLDERKSNEQWCSNGLYHRHCCSRGDHSRAFSGSMMLKGLDEKLSSGW